MNNFNLIFQQTIYNIETNTYTYPSQQKASIDKEYRSFDQLKHFCDTYNLKLDLLQNDESKRFAVANLYFQDNSENNRFEYYFKYNPHYYAKYKDLFRALEAYKQKYIITLDGTKNSKIILWG